jgi:hypothetical protein
MLNAPIKSTFFALYLSDSCPVRCSREHDFCFAGAA